MLDPAQRVRDGRHVGGTVRAEDQQACWLAPAGQHAEQIDGGRVTPVQVFEQQHECGVPGQGLQGLDQLAQHPTAAGPVRTTPHGLHVAVAQQARKLLQPGRRMLLEHLDQLVPARRASQSPQRFEHRQIRFCGSVLLHALPATDAQRARWADFREEHLDQGGLADSRLAGHEHELPLPAEGTRQPGVQAGHLRLSADQRRSRARWCGEARDGLDGRLAFGRCGTRQGDDRRRRVHRTDEPESASVHRLDVPRGG